MALKAIKIDDDVADVLRRGSWDGTLFKLPAGQLDRKLYERVDRALQALGGKWNRSAGGHLFTVAALASIPTDVQAALMRALDQGHVVDQKKTLEQFFTPPELAERMADEVGIARFGAVTHVLEPSAGDGRLARAALEAGASVTAVEIDRELCHRLANDLGQRFRGDIVICHGDFMNWVPAARPIDAVMMNPPFSGNQDIKHVLRALDFLRPGGRLAAIMSPHFTFAQDSASRTLRKLIGYPEGEGARDGAVACEPSVVVADASVELLPAGTFKQAGTNVAAVLVIIELED